MNVNEILDLVKTDKEVQNLIIDFEKARRKYRTIDLIIRIRNSKVKDKAYQIKKI